MSMQYMLIFNCADEIKQLYLLNLFQNSLSLHKFERQKMNERT